MGPISSNRELTPSGINSPTLRCGSFWSFCGVETQLGTDLPVAAEVPNGDKLPGYGLKDFLAIDWLISTGSDVSESTHRVT
ncbi:unnamed protein product [Phytophthora lilii]|uniref:Unnamed protein product n=1 Tax=Phytophthora lilii TaxID=2077276 RepID=A0A9W6XK70_9STRA|nr:unnamed protein product [Phytophthora lilii]